MSKQLHPGLLFSPSSNARLLLRPSLSRRVVCNREMQADARRTVHSSLCSIKLSLLETSFCEGVRVR